MQYVNAGLAESQAGIKTAGRNINDLRYADDITLVAESEEELQSMPGESQGRRSLVGCRLRGHTESDMTEAT